MKPFQRLEIARKRAGYATRSEGARALSVGVSTYTHHENGTRIFDSDLAVHYARRFHTTPKWLLYGKGDYPVPPDVRKSVRLVGYVGAGSIAHFYEGYDDPNETVDAPDGITTTTVAAEIRGNSLGPTFDKALVFYDDIHTPPTPELIKKLCVVGLDNGQVLIKQLLTGTLPGHYHLLSNTDGVIENALVRWAARVKTVVLR